MTARPRHDPPRGHVTVDAVQVPIPGGTPVIVDPRHHREDVVRRLLQLGVSTRTLRALLPEWNQLILRVATAVDGPDGRSTR